VNPLRKGVLKDEMAISEDLIVARGEGSFMRRERGGAGTWPS